MKGNTASEGDVINYDRVFANSLNTLRSGSFDERKIVIMSFCEAEDDDNTCDRQGNIDPDNEIEVIVLNGCGGIENEFSCLINDEQLVNFATIDENTLQLLSSVDDIEQACEEPTLSPY